MLGMESLSLAVGRCLAIMEDRGMAERKERIGVLGVVNR